jgi:hypothetical protein
MPLGRRQDFGRVDLGEAEWRLLEPFPPPERGRKSRPAFDIRQIANDILSRITFRKMSAPRRIPRSRFQPCIPAMCACTGASCSRREWN